MDWRSPRVRLFIIAGVVVLWMGAALGRLAYLQLFCYSDYLARAERQQQRIVEISPRRGILYDRNLHELAMSTSVDSLFAVPSEIKDHEMVARFLSRVLNASQDELESKLAGSSTFVWIERKLSPEKVERIKQMNLRGIYFVKERERFYPKNQLASHVLGYVDIDEKGLGGIEYSLDSQIRGRPGRMMVLADARRRWFDSSEQGAEAGSNVVLTLDQNVQFIAEKELARAIQDTHAIAGSIIIEDPATGEILAMANQPTFNPNARSEASVDARMDRAVAAMYEPGSVFKIVTLAAALEEGITNPEEVVDCQNGAIYVAGHRIRDHKSFGLLTVSQVLAKSSDVGAIKIGLRLGAPKLYDYIRAFGFGVPSGIDLPGEAKGKLRRLENWTPVSVGSISMGQEVGVTAIQLISSMNVIANGGLWIRPHIVRGMRRDTTFVPATGQPEPRRVIRANTAATLRSMLEGVVLEGTGTKARLDGYTAAGKTGTAQKFDPATGHYSLRQTIASFVGFAPINTPAVTILITLDSPVGLVEGGDTAAPVFKRVAEQVLSYMGIPQDAPLGPRSRRASTRPGASTSEADVSDFDPSQMESATAPADLVAPPQHSSASIAHAPTLALVEGEAVTVPALSGKTVREVSVDCARLGITPVLVGTGVALEQDPVPGATVRRGSRVTVRFGRPSHGAALPPAHPPGGQSMDRRP